MRAKAKAETRHHSCSPRHIISPYTAAQGALKAPVIGVVGRPYGKERKDACAADLAETSGPCRTLTPNQWDPSARDTVAEVGANFLWGERKMQLRGGLDLDLDLKPCSFAFCLLEILFPCGTGRAMDSDTLITSSPCRGSGLAFLHRIELSTFPARSARKSARAKLGTRGCDILQFAFQQLFCQELHVHVRMCH